MKKETILQVLLAVCIFMVGVFAGKNLQEILQKRAADALAIEMMEQELLAQQEKENPKEEIIPPKSEVEKPSVSENETASENVTSSQNEVSNDGYKPTWNDSYVDPEVFQTLSHRLAVRSSYDETALVNTEDKEIIANSTLDFSNMTIVCIGDSITAGYVGSQEVVPYPIFLKNILGAKEVINLGIGGATFAKGDGVSSIADRAANYNEDIDLLIVMGGTNDNFAQSEGMFGSPYIQYNSEDSFCGGLAWLMERRKNDHPDIPVLYVMPPANALIDELRLDNPSLLPQERYAEAFRKIGADHGCKPVDLYSMNFLNSHDVNVQNDYVVDLVHFNTVGNEILAERIASEIIVRYME